MKQTRDEIKRKSGGADLDNIREEEDDERTQLLLGYDPRTSFDQEVEDALQGKRSRFEFLSHAFMFFLLVLIVTPDFAASAFASDRIKAISSRPA